VWLAGGCRQKTIVEQTNTLNIQSELTQNEVQIFETLCDSIYGDKGYKIVQQYFQRERGIDGIDTIFDNNMIFQLFSNSEIIYQDTLFSFVGIIDFRDFNGDNLKDILIQNISDVRSNWTYYLLIVDTLQNKVKKITGFEEIKNPNYLPQYNLIDNYVMSGTNWTSFYEIQNDTIRDFNIVIYDDLRDTSTAYEDNYEKAIKKILKQKKIEKTN
jgi:hypothetical protein